MRHPPAHRLHLLPLLALAGVVLACVDGPGPGERRILITGPAFQIGSIPGFTEWITEPGIFNDPVQTLLLCPDDDVAPCTEVTRQRSGISGGEYGYDADQDGTVDVILTAEAVLVSDVQALSDGSYQYSWAINNLGTGAVSGVPCGPNAPTFAISSEAPLLGTAGEDRLPGTGDDLGSGETHTSGALSQIAAATVLCTLHFNPSTGRVLELLVPLPASPTSREQCKDGGWQDFGFADQGQCIRFVETGKDSRVGG